MPTEKREMPYARLKRICCEWAGKCENLQQRGMFTIPTKGGQSWTLDDVYERTKAADTLGWDVVLKAEDGGRLAIVYRKRPPRRPGELW